MRYPQILNAARSSIWAIHRPKLEAILQFLDTKASGGSVDARLVEQMAAENRGRGKAVVSRSVAVLPLLGTITQRSDMLTEFSGGTSTDRWGREFDQLVADPEVGSIVLDVDSPGGTVYGVPELAAKVHAARGTKPIIAVANSMAASAAYYIASAADEVVVTPSGDVGSIGVIAVHANRAGEYEQAGVEYDIVTYGKHKAEHADTGPLADETRAEIQRRVDEDGKAFDAAVAKHRGVTPETVRKTFGQGRMFGAKEAVQRGMADRVATLDETVARMAKGGRAKKRTRSAIARRRLDLADRA